MRLFALCILLAFPKLSNAQGSVKFIVSHDNDTLFCSKIAVDGDDVYAFRQYKPKPLKIPRSQVMCIDYNDPVISQSCNDIYAEFIYTAPGKSKDELYRAARVWVAEAYVNADYALQMDNADLGSMVIKGTIKGYWETAPILEHMIRIDVKDEKIRLILSNVEFDRLVSDHAFDLKYYKNTADALFSYEINKYGKPHKTELVDYHRILKSLIVSSTDIIDKHLGNSDW